MKVLVTGASGLLGRAVATELIGAGHEVRCFQRRPSGVTGAEDALGSVTDPDDVAHAVSGCDAIVHLAAKVSLAGEAAEFERVNVAGHAKHSRRGTGGGRLPRGPRVVTVRRTLRRVDRRRRRAAG